jgi:hypothetical protein
MMLSLLIACALLSAPEEAPRFRVTTTAGPVGAGSLTKLEDFDVALSGVKPVSIAADQLVELRRDGAALPAGPPGPFVVLGGGDRLPIAIPPHVVLDDERVRFVLAEPLARSPKGPMLVPQAGVTAVCFRLPTGVDGFGGLAGMAAKNRDVLVLRNGDRLEGTLSKLGDAGATLVQPGRTVDLPLDRIAAVLFNPELQARTQPRKAFGQLVLRSGARLRATSLKLDDKGQLHAVLPVGGTLVFPVDQMVSLQARNGPAVYLDEREPMKFESTPFLDSTWPLAVHRTLLNRSLRLGGDVYDSGLAMHSRSRVTYALAGAYRSFEATVGVDPAAGPRGAVRIDVEIDSKSATGVSRVLRAGEAPASLRVDVSGARTLTLVTDFGPLGNVQGHAIWADPRLIKK